MPSAENVLRERIRQSQEQEAIQEQEAAERRQALQQETAHRKFLLVQELADEAKAAISRLEQKGFPDGELLQVVSGYSRHHTWYGKRYMKQHHEVRACWRLEDGIRLSSDGLLRTVSPHPQGFRDSNGQVLVGLRAVDPDTLAEESTTWLEYLLEQLQQL